MTTPTDTLVNQLVTTADAIRESGRAQGKREANRDYFGQSAVRLTAGIFATALGAAAQQMTQYSPLAAQFFALKAQEFQAFATPPTVQSVSPQQDAANIATTDQIVLKFAVPMDENFLTDANVYVGPASGGAHLATALSYDETTHAVTLVPSNELSSGVTYKVTVSKAVRSMSGQPLQTDFTSTFTTV